MTLDYFYGQAGELFSFYRIPKALFQEPRFQNLSTDAKTLYGILLDRMSLSAKNGWLDEQGRVCRKEGRVTVQKMERKEKSESPPQLYDLTALQRDANRLLGFTAQQTLDYWMGEPQ